MVCEDSKQLRRDPLPSEIISSYCKTGRPFQVSATLSSTRYMEKGGDSILDFRQTAGPPCLIEDVLNDCVVRFASENTRHTRP